MEYGRGAFRSAECYYDPRSPGGQRLSGGSITGKAMLDPLAYHSALSERNASAAMQAIWSPQRKFSTWR
ncbi:MAG: hypothetical protein IT442_12780, partial [Phycisphaeraceae bacterium]|nr:hypothetical protein [Phycisphaeraceae bacterium]